MQSSSEWDPSCSRMASSIMGSREEALYSWHRSASPILRFSSLRFSLSMSGKPVQPA